MSSMSRPKEKRREQTIALQPSRMVTILASAAFLLILISLGTQLTRYVWNHDYVYGILPLAERLLHVNNEFNIPTLFSVCLFSFASSLLMCITVLKLQDGDRDRYRWMVLAMGFLYLAVDESWSIHESFFETGRWLLGGNNHGLFYYDWVVPGLLASTVVGLSFMGFLSRLPPQIRSLSLVAGGMYIGGALGFEMLGGRYDEFHGSLNMTYQLFVHVEEGLEMAGVILFIFTLLRYVEENYRHISILVGDGVPQESTDVVSLRGRKTA